MKTILIIGSTEKIRSENIAEHIRSWNISIFDQITPADEAHSIGISEIRAFTKKLFLAPQKGNHVAGIIARGERLTTEAQQALLKTLEEPPAHAYIILGIPNVALLLPTIISRCVCITLQDSLHQNTKEQMKQTSDELQSLMTASAGRRIAILSTLGKSKEDLESWIDDTIMSLRHTLLESQNNTSSHDGAEHLRLVHALMETKKYQENNVNSALLLEHAFLSLPYRV